LIPSRPTVKIDFTLRRELTLPWRHFVLGTMSICGFSLSSCDKAPQKTSAAQTNTTQENNAQPSNTDSNTAPSNAVAADPLRPVPANHSISLVNLPITLSVPKSWVLNPPMNPVFLQGPAPDGNVQISLSMLDSMDAHRKDVYVSTLLDEGHKHPRRIQVRQETSKNGISILERITYTPGSDEARTSLTSTTAPSATISWDIILFLPYDKKFIPCRFDLFGLTQDQYRDDRQFIDSIIDSAEPGKFPAAR
jgi:hypothetical protein